MRANICYTYVNLRNDADSALLGVLDNRAGIRGRVDGGRGESGVGLQLRMVFPLWIVFGGFLFVTTPQLRMVCTNSLPVSPTRVYM